MVLVVAGAVFYAVSRPRGVLLRVHRGGPRIDGDGRITCKSRPGPFGFKVEPVARALEALAGPAVKPS